MSANQPTRLSTSIQSDDFLDKIDTRSTLETAAAGFIKSRNNTTIIWAASRDWFLEEWGRDTFVSLPGLLITTRRYEEAKQVFSHFAQYERYGLIPNVINDHELLYNTADASLLFIFALQAYVRTTHDWAFATTLLPTVRNIITGYTHGTTYRRGGAVHVICADADGLIVSPAQATWMDADPAGDGSAAVTPRNGKCVEINAFWYGALCFARELEAASGDDWRVSILDAQMQRVRTAFRAKFWWSEKNCLYDVIEGDAQGATIRPNQQFAVSHGGDLLDPDQQSCVMEVVRRELLTPGGLRSLARSDEHYHGSYDTYAPMSEKDLAYHQGTIWPWLIGSYCDATRIVRAHQGAAIDTVTHEIRHTIAPLVQFCLDSPYRSLPEVFSADAPYEPGGTTSQAWSVAEVLRVLASL